MNKVLRHVMIGLVCVLLAVAGSITFMSSDVHDRRLNVHQVLREPLAEKEQVVRALIRRGALDAASHRYSRARRAFDAAGRAAQGHEELLRAVDDQRNKSERLFRKDDV